MNKTIVIDISGLISLKFISGIQRVVLEYAIRFITSDIRTELVYYNANNIKFYKIDKIKFIDVYRTGGLYQKSKTKKVFHINKLDSDYIWFDMDAAWSSSFLRRNVLYTQLKKRNVHIVTLCHDIFPISYPSCVFDIHTYYFLIYVSAVFDLADEIIVTSNFCKNEIHSYLSKCKIQKKVHVVPLGSNLKDKRYDSNIDPTVKALSRKKYLLMVGTIEPRKNYGYLLDCFDRYLSNDINLVLAGRIGWNCKNIVMRINKHKLLNDKLFFINAPTDNDLVFLYKHAFAFVTPSFAEGYCIPVVEALHYNCPVFASNIDIFKETSQNLAILFDNKKCHDLYCKVKIYLNNRAKYDMLKTKISKFNPVTWDMSFDMLIDVFKRSTYGR